jgi:transposase
MLTALGRGIRAGHTGEPVAAAEIGLDEIAVPAQRFAQCGDLSRHVLLRNNARQLMAYLGRVRSEHSSGTRIRRGGIAKAGNVLARRVLIEGAWTYRMPARVSRKLHDRNEKLSSAVRDIAWKAQLRLCLRYRRLAAVGKPKVVVIAREMVGFIWAIAGITQPSRAA